MNTPERIDEYCAEIQHDASDLNVNNPDHAEMIADALMYMARAVRVTNATDRAHYARWAIEQLQGIAMVGE